MTLGVVVLVVSVAPDIPRRDEFSSSSVYDSHAHTHHIINDTPGTVLGFPQARYIQPFF